MSLPRRFGRNAIANYLSSAVALVLGLLVTPILVRGLGKEAYGTLVLATSAVLYLDLLKFGFGRATVKYVAESEALGDSERTRRTISTSFLSLVAPATLVLAASPALAFLFPVLFDIPDSLVVPAMVIVVLTAVDLACSIPSDTFGSALIGLQRYDLLNATLTATAIAQAAAWTVILALDGGLIAIGAATLAFDLAGQLARYLLVRKAVGPPVPRLRQFDRVLVKPLLTMSGWIALNELADVVIARIDTIVVGLVVGIPQAAVYAVGQKLAMLTARFTSPAAAQFFPHASELAAAGDREGLRAMLLTGTRLGVAIATPLVVIPGVLAGPALRVWVGPGFGDAALVVVFLSASTLVATVSRTAVYVLRGMGDVKGPALFMVLEAVLNLPLSIVLGVTMGLQGVALGTLIATSIAHFGFVLPYSCRRAETSVRALLLVVLRANLPPAMATLALGLLLRRSGVTGIVELVGAGAALFAVYTIVLLVTGLSSVERRRLVSFVSRLFGDRFASYIARALR